MLDWQSTRGSVVEFLAGYKEQHEARDGVIFRLRGPSRQSELEECEEEMEGSSYGSRLESQLPLWHDFGLLGLHHDGL